MLYPLDQSQRNDPEACQVKPIEGGQDCSAGGPPRGAGAFGGPMRCMTIIDPGCVCRRTFATTARGSDWNASPEVTSQPTGCSPSDATSLTSLGPAQPPGNRK